MIRQFDPANPELMDRPQPVSPALERDLANLRHLNRWFGARRILHHVLQPAMTGEGGESGSDRPRSLLITDFCSGSGDLPREMVAMGKRHGVRVQVEAVEAHPATSAIGRAFCEGIPEIRFFQTDVREWEPSTSPPDWIVCSLALHHFTETDALTILRKMWHHARRGVLLADLERCWWAVGGIYAASIFYREPMTRGDMRRSALAAFSFSELRGLVDSAGWEEVTHRRFFYGRQALWAMKPVIH